MGLSPLSSPDPLTMWGDLELVFSGGIVECDSHSAPYRALAPAIKASFKR